MTTEAERKEWRKASAREDSRSWDQPREYMFLRKLAEVAEIAVPALLDENDELRKEVERLEMPETWCPEHGGNVKLDEDLCCAGCGNAAMIDRDRVEYEHSRLDERSKWIDELRKEVERLENDLITAKTKIAELEVRGLRCHEDVKHEVAVDYLCRAERAEAQLERALTMIDDAQSSFDGEISDEMSVEWDKWRDGALAFLDENNGGDDG